MRHFTILCRAEATLSVLGSDGILITIPKGKTITLLDAYTHEDTGQDVAVFIHEEEDGNQLTFEMELEAIRPHLRCMECN